MARRSPRHGIMHGGSPDDRPSELVEEFDKLSRETETDALLDALEKELSDWAPEEEDEETRDTVIDRLNRQLVAKSVFREGFETGYHEDMGNQRPIESEVRRGLEDLKKLIDQGKPRSRR